MSDRAIRSPCVGVCELDATGHCRGCRRTLEEVAGWITYTRAQRDAIIAELDHREPGPTRGDGQER
jgi:predicted Fe-S protein YdhL (DUF1289 family)